MPGDWRRLIFVAIVVTLLNYVVIYCLIKYFKHKLMPPSLIKILHRVENILGIPVSEDDNAIDDYGKKTVAPPTMTIPP